MQHFNNALKENLKVDSAIIYSLIKMATIAAQPYNTQTERKYKYYQMKDLIFIQIFPAIIPKVTDKSIAEKYFKIKKHINNIPRIEQNLDFFEFLLEESMILADTILFNSNYYLMENFTDQDYEDMLSKGEVEFETV